MTGNLQPNGERLTWLMGEFATPEVGGTPAGGVSRPAGSDADGRARQRFAEIAVEFGLEVTVDDIGNMYARRHGSDPDALPVVVGSHLDTVVPGGRFDGILGVCLALETMATLDDHALTTRRSIMAVNWTGEEGARFPPAMIGSGVVAGVWDGDYARSRVDSEGLLLGDELRRIGFMGSREHRLNGFRAALEAHIEQGTQLENAGCDVGIVTAINPVRWVTVRIVGAGGHAGGPGPSERQEALVAASRMVVAARDLSVAGGSSFTTTVGTISALPGSNNVIPHEVTFNLDIRSVDDATVDRHLAAVAAAFEDIARQEGVNVRLEGNWSMASAPFDEDVRRVLVAAADTREVKTMTLRGSIGHDTLHLASLGPAAMLFTRTTAGLSHCEEEEAPWDAVLATAGVLTTAVLELAEIAPAQAFTPVKETTA